MAPSRIAAVLAARWLNYTKEPVRDYLARRRALDDDWQRFVDFRSKHREDPPPPSRDYDCGLRAVLMSLEGLADERRWPAASGDEPTSPQLAAVALLGLLEPYGAGTFPADILDDPDWSGGRSGLDDRRLDVLNDLGLVDRSDGLPYFSDFGVNPIIREAVRHRPSQQRSVGIATRTLLHLMDNSKARGARAQLDLLPHAERLALRIAPDTERPGAPVGCVDDDPDDIRPLAAVELHARAAACHLGLQKNRVASAQLARMDHVLVQYRTEIRKALKAKTMDWSGAARRSALV